MFSLHNEEWWVTGKNLALKLGEKLLEAVVGVLAGSGRLQAQVITVP